MVKYDILTKIKCELRFKAIIMIKNGGKKHG